MKKPFRITGFHVLAGMVGFFAIIIAVNMVFLTLAVRTFPGEQEKKSYMQGLQFNDRLEAREAQAALGWSVDIEQAARTDESGLIELAFKSKEDAPIYKLTVEGVLSRPADDDHDIALAFTPSGPGRYQAQTGALGPGVWTLKASAANSREESFEFETKIYFE